MVPGLTERERRAADVRRLEWLADSMVGPMHVTWEPSQSTTTPRARTILPIGLWRRGLASARVHGSRLRLTQPGGAGSVLALAPTE